MALRQVFIGLLFASGAVAPALAQNATIIDASLSFVFDRLSPDPVSGLNVTHNYHVTLSGANNVSEERSASAGAREYRSNMTRILGQSGDDFGVRGAWKVAGPSTLVRQRSLPQSIETVTIRVAGKSCEISVTNRLKPGFSTYKYPRVGSGEWQIYSQPRTVGTSCAIR